jgi:rod shape-determining protein MreD
MDDRRRTSFLASVLGVAAALALAVVPMPETIAAFRPDWVAVILIYWSLAAPRRVGLLLAFLLGILLDTLTGALLGQHALALVLVVYLAEHFYLRVRVFPVSQLAVTVFVLLGLYEFVLFWIDGIAGRTVPVIERWAPPITGTLVWMFLVTFIDSGRRETRARL